jgi:hypothetical protein
VLRPDIGLPQVLVLRARGQLDLMVKPDPIAALVQEELAAGMAGARQGLCEV